MPGPRQPTISAEPTLVERLKALYKMRQEQLEQTHRLHKQWPSTEPGSGERDRLRWKINRSLSGHDPYGAESTISAPGWASKFGKALESVTGAVSDSPPGQVVGKLIRDAAGLPGVASLVRGADQLLNGDESPPGFHVAMAAQRIAPERAASRVTRDAVRNLFLKKGNERRALAASALDTSRVEAGDTLDHAIQRARGTYDRLLKESNPKKFNPDHIRRQIESGMEGKDWYLNIAPESRKYLGSDADLEFHALNAVGSWSTPPSGQLTKALVPKVARLRGASPAEASAWGGMPNQRKAMQRIFEGDLSVAENAAEDVGGRKNLAYYKAGRGDLDPIVADRHMGRDWGLHEYDPKAELLSTEGEPITGGWVRYADSPALNQGASLAGHRVQGANSLLPHEYDLVEDVLPVLGREFNLHPTQAQAAEWFASKKSQQAMFEDLLKKGTIKPGQGNKLSWQDAPINEHLKARWQKWGYPEVDPTMPMPTDLRDAVWDQLMFDKNVRKTPTSWREYANGRKKDDVVRIYRPVISDY